MEITQPKRRKSILAIRRHRSVCHILHPLWLVCSTAICNGYRIIISRIQCFHRTQDCQNITLSKLFSRGEPHFATHPIKSLQCTRPYAALLRQPGKDGICPPRWSTHSWNQSILSTCFDFIQLVLFENADATVHCPSERYRITYFNYFNANCISVFVEEKFHPFLDVRGHIDNFRHITHYDTCTSTVSTL